MSMMDADNRYGAVSRALHWSMAILLLVNLSSEVWFEALEHRWSDSDLMAWHQTLGLTVFGLLLFRLAWRWVNRSKISMPENWARMAKIGHLALYGLMILMPLSGLATSLGEGDPVSLFGWMVFAPGPEMEWLEDAGEEIHEVLATVFWAAIGIHVAAALAHQFWLGDRVMKRMA
ncbi:MAG: cytochrome b [Gammaproteobacteria bacterium]|uniref:Cytochrome B561 n=1 Tax=Marinobacter nitratireducens TaxID=1137280 RepID=A0A072N1G3_9GAMM|nr:cytochrome b [Marinobacter nitratireducens]KEF31356.1 Cytochrome B561 [Marinobacter nitratireducens]TNE72583.1 MAG: cytochrome b [Gammaproteobacteria bacterium]TNE95064.1 MAG: cytochrome b [Gammaproteobacteria bacterium]